MTSPLAAARDTQALGLQHVLNRAAARSGCLGTMIDKRPLWRRTSMAWTSAAISSSPSWVEIAAQVLRSPICLCSRRTSASSAGGGSGVDFQIACHHDRPRAELAETERVKLGLGDDKRQVFKQRLGEVAAPLPGGERAVRKPAVDQNLRHAARAKLQNGHRPDFGFGDDRQIRLPMRQEAADGGLQVQRHILVDDIVAEPVGGQRAEVTVPVVKTTEMDSELKYSSSGITAEVSPTLAACSQTSGPSGRGTALRP